MFEGYKLKYRLNARHSFCNDRDNIHPHTFEISLSIETYANEFISFSIVDEIIEQFLLKYQNKYLNEVSPFNQVEPTIENIGNTFYEDLKEILYKKHFNLLQLEISETPLRIYMISDRLMYGELNK